MKADACAIAKTAIRKERNLFMVISLNSAMVKRRLMGLKLVSFDDVFGCVSLLVLSCVELT